MKNRLISPFSSIMNRILSLDRKLMYLVFPSTKTALLCWIIYVFLFFEEKVIQSRFRALIKAPKKIWIFQNFEFFRHGRFGHKNRREFDFSDRYLFKSSREKAASGEDHGLRETHLGRNQRFEQRNSYSKKGLTLKHYVMICRVSQKTVEYSA